MGFDLFFIHLRCSVGRKIDKGYGFGGDLLPSIFAQVASSSIRTST